MILLSDSIWQGKSWQEELAGAAISLAELLERLALPAELVTAATGAARDFPLRVPEPYLRRIRPGDIDDPLLRQILPRAEELQHYPGFTQDPLGEREQNPVPGLIHKYQGRVLLVTTGACAIHCRYCFRRHFPYASNRPGKGTVEQGGKWQAALDYIRKDSSISEVILSGGDPLVASDSDLQSLCGQLETIPHLRRLRVHSRLPVVIPQRITGQCLDWLSRGRLKTSLVIHCNHPAEIDTGLGLALSRLREASVPVLNQAVLLKDVNDHSEVLCELSEKLFDHQVLPYYLHLLDPVSGAGHFWVGPDRARALMRSLSARLPGYLVPKLVKEDTGATAKTPIHY